MEKLYLESLNDKDAWWYFERRKRWLWDLREGNYPHYERLNEELRAIERTFWKVRKNTSKG